MINLEQEKFKQWDLAALLFHISIYAYPLSLEIAHDQIHLLTGAEKWMLECNNISHRVLQFLRCS